MKIERIKVKKNNQYEIIFEDNSKIVLEEDVILEYNLLYKKEICDELYQKLISKNEYYKAYNKTLKYVSTKWRSKKQVNDYLDKLGLINEDKTNIITKLTNLGMINDLVFAKAYGFDKVYLNKVGPNKIRRELRAAGVNDEIIEESLTYLDYDLVIKNLTHIIKKHIKNNKKYSNYMLKNKLINNLTNQGYLYEDINDIFEVNKKNNNIIEKEYEKQYKKLSLKYSGQDLYFKIKDALYKKGFEIDEINNFLQEKDCN